MAAGRQSTEMIRESFMDTGVERSIRHTMGSAGVVSIISLPNDVKGFKLKPSADLRFTVAAEGAVRTPQAIGATSGTTVAASAFDAAKGGYALAGIVEVRLLPPYNGRDVRTLSLLGLAGAETADIEVF